MRSLGDLKAAEQAYLEAIEHRLVAGDKTMNIITDKVNLSVTYLLMSRYPEAKILDDLVKSIGPASRISPRQYQLMIELCLVLFGMEWRLGDAWDQLYTVEADLDELKFTDDDVLTLKMCGFCTAANQQQLANHAWSIVHTPFKRSGKDSEAEALKEKYRLWKCIFVTVFVALYFLGGGVE